MVPRRAAQGGGRINAPHGGAVITMEPSVLVIFILAAVITGMLLSRRR